MDNPATPSIGPRRYMYAGSDPTHHRVSYCIQIYSIEWTGRESQSGPEHRTKPPRAHNLPLVQYTSGVSGALSLMHELVHGGRDATAIHRTWL